MYVSKQLLLVAIVATYTFADAGDLNSLSQVVPKISPGARVTVNRGETIELTCGIEYSDDSEYALTWKKGSSILIANSIIMKAPTGTSVAKNGVNLIKKNAQLDDAGDYTCTLATTPSVSVTYDVKIAYLDSITLMPPKPVDLREGDKLHLNCQGTGYPTPEPSWLFENKPVTNATIIKLAGDLIVDKITTSQSGLYQCNLDNGSGEKLSSSVRVNVFASDKVIRKPESGLVMAKVGDNVKLSCQVEGQGKKETKWYFKGAELEGVEGEELMLKDVQSANDGEYVCKIKSTVYTNLEAKFRVTIEPPVESSSDSEAAAVESVSVTPSSNVSAKKTAHIVAILTIVILVIFFW